MTRRQYEEQPGWLMSRLLPSLTVSLAVAGASAQLLAQDIGSLSAERARLREITGQTGDKPLVADSVPRFGTYWPRFRITTNSSIPYAGNDGSIWAGRGINTSLTAGLDAQRRFDRTTIRATLAPTLTWSENRPFQIVPTTFTSAIAPGRSEFSSPWQTGIASADLPLRFGRNAVTSIDWGESVLAIDYDRLSVGATSASNWWGPGRRSALVMSNNGPGIPRLFVRTTRPVQTAFGSFDGELIAGLLQESAFFDSIPRNDRRSLSGLRLTWQPTPTLTIGTARTVFRPMTGSAAGTLGRGLDVLRLWEPLRAPGDTTSLGEERQRSDQVASVFARWFDPGSGLEIYGEWARMELPRSVAELIESTSHTLGYTLGMEYAVKQRRPTDYLNFQAEVTYLEQSTVIPSRPPPDYYSGGISPQGYTNRGQVIGAWTGPGSSSQWFAIDYVTPRWQSGAFVGRIRWANDAMYRYPEAGRSHDFTVFGGFRAGVRGRRYDLASELTIAKRHNYLFQYGWRDPVKHPTVDVGNVTVSLLLSPRTGS